jgi:hypothetical protein
MRLQRPTLTAWTSQSDLAGVGRCEARDRTSGRSRAQTARPIRSRRRRRDPRGWWGRLLWFERRRRRWRRVIPGHGRHCHPVVDPDRPELQRRRGAAAPRRIRHHLDVIPGLSRSASSSPVPGAGGGWREVSGHDGPRSAGGCPSWWPWERSHRGERVDRAGTTTIPEGRSGGGWGLAGTSPGSARTGVMQPCRRPRTVRQWTCKSLHITGIDGRRVKPGMPTRPLCGKTTSVGKN